MAVLMYAIHDAQDRKLSPATQFSMWLHVDSVMGSTFVQDLPICYGRYLTDYKNFMMRIATLHACLAITC